jgi:hypothetical protein
MPRAVCRWKAFESKQGVVARKNARVIVPRPEMQIVANEMEDWRRLISTRIAPAEECAHVFEHSRLDYRDQRKLTYTVVSKKQDHGL